MNVNRSCVTQNTHTAIVLKCANKSAAGFKTMPCSIYYSSIIKANISCELIVQSFILYVMQLQNNVIQLTIAERFNGNSINELFLNDN